MKFLFYLLYRTFTRDGTSVVVDTGSFELIKGSTIDYTQELIRR
jgi:Fe-S cluster assembly iron-binding protein IscA